MEIILDEWVSLVNFNIAYFGPFDIILNGVPLLIAIPRIRLRVNQSASLFFRS